MKTVKYQGKTFQVPDWANYIAADYDRVAYVYELAPNIVHSFGQYRYYASGGQVTDLAGIAPVLRSKKQVYPVFAIPVVPRDEPAEEINPGIELLIADLHKGTISAASLFAPDPKRICVGDKIQVIKGFGKGFSGVVVEINLWVNGTIEYAIEGGGWYRADNVTRVK